MAFQEKLAAHARLMETRLAYHLTPGAHFGPPERLAAAMQHGTLGGGKRFRPFLLLESAALFGVSPHDAADTAAALECVHCYSLIHDDLPAMDDDDLRRGKPTVHKAFDEATAILAGDALLTLAFEILSAPETHSDPNVRIRLVQELAIAAGWAGMAGGQMLDLEAEKKPKTRLAIIQRIHAMKTGSLIEFACVAGAILGRAAPEAEEQIRRFGQILGHLFQASDDLLDAVGETDKLGKTAGKDAAAGKATIVSRMGVEKAKGYVADLAEAALEALAPFGARAETLAEATRFLMTRDH